MREEVEKAAHETHTPLTIDIKERAITPEDIQVGTIITGINEVWVLDDLLDRFGSMLVSVFPRDLRYRPSEWHLFGRKPTKVLPAYAEKRHFYGALKDWEVVILPPDLILLPKGDSANFLEPIEPVTFLTRVGLYSTGRGKVGELSAKSTIASCLSRKKTDPELGIPEIIIATKPLSGSKQREIEALIAQSRINWEDNYRYNLTHQLSGGLPGLGKRT